MVNQPRRPLSHFAASSAPWANTARSRTVCVSVTVSDGAVEADDVRAGNVPGARGRHVDRTRCSRPAASRRTAAAPCRTARPSWRRGAPRGSRRRRRSVANACAAVLDEQPEHVHADREIRRREHADARPIDEAAKRRLRAPAIRSCRCTTLMWRAASAARFFGTASGMRELDGHVHRSGRLERHGERACGSRRCRPPRSRARAPASRRAGPSGRGRRRAASRGHSEKPLVHAQERRFEVGFANHERDVTPRRGLRHHANRNAARAPRAGG